MEQILKLLAEATLFLKVSKVEDIYVLRDGGFQKIWLLH